MDFNEINKLSEQFSYSKKYWDRIVECMISDDIISESKIEVIPNDIWSWAKRCISSSDKVLIAWFNSNIPAFYGEKPIDIIRVENGEYALKELMMRLPL
ncbi:hypothetical protein ACQPU1_07410 [Clostridium paraputrificum]|uniref:hypothetical protein n=1 Tax=Clostridium TaxID=1485 RepID=UPI003D3321AD